MAEVSEAHQSWLRHHALLRTASSLRLGILHADFGKLFELTGSDCIPHNRLFFAVDHCGCIAVERDDGRKEAFEISAGSITFIPAGQRLHYDFEPGRLSGFHFHLEAFPGVDLLENELPRQISTPDTRKACEDMLELLEAKFTVATMMRTSAALLEAASNFSTIPPDRLDQQIVLRERYAALAQIIESELDASMTIQSLATRLSLTRDQLSKRFRKDLGEPLKRYLTRMLIRRSCELLLKGCNVKSTAQQLKFSNEFYFSRFFKKEMKISPSEYIASIRRR